MRAARCCAPEHVDWLPIDDSPSRRSYALAIMRAPRHARLTEWAWRACQEKDRAGIRLEKAAHTCCERESTARICMSTFAHTRCSAPFVPRLEGAHLPQPSGEFGPGVYTVHLWKQMWNREG